MSTFRQMNDTDCRNTAKRTKSEQLCREIRMALQDGAVDEWDAREFSEARRLTATWGCVWDFMGWRDTMRTVMATGRLGGVDLN